MTHSNASHNVIYCKINGVTMPYDVSSERPDYYDDRYFELLGLGCICESSGKLYMSNDNKPVQLYFFKRRMKQQ